jgi:flagellin-like hook-associated protein FlgL
MSNVVLSSGIRNALQSLQTSASLAEIQQTRLATGKKVNSALDNPANFFTASALNDRAGDLSGLLDSMGQAVKTIEAADKGIGAIKKLVETAQGIARQALQTNDATQRATYADQFDDLRTQIDQLAGDAGYNGTNLLDSDTLNVQFNEDNSSNLTLTGVDASTTGLAVAASANAWAGDADITSSLDELSAAVSSLRATAATFGSNLAVVQNRQDFTKSLVGTLQSGADALTVADPNEEGAKLLALNTRQQLASTALGLASQQQQAVLRLF